jgi:hypothetical protein
MDPPVSVVFFTLPHSNLSLHSCAFIDYLITRQYRLLIPVQSGKGTRLIQQPVNFLHYFGLNNFPGRSGKLFIAVSGKPDQAAALFFLAEIPVFAAGFVTHAVMPFNPDQFGGADIVSVADIGSQVNGHARKVRCLISRKFRGNNNTALAGDNQVTKVVRIARTRIFIDDPKCRHDLRCLN